MGLFVSTSSAQQFEELGQRALPGVTTTSGSPEVNWILEVNGGGVVLGVMHPPKTNANATSARWAKRTLFRVLNMFKVSGGQSLCRFSFFASIPETSGIPPRMPLGNSRTK